MLLTLSASFHIPCPSQKCCDCPAVTLKLGTGIASDDMVTVDVEQTTVFRTNDGANIIWTLTHSGARPWMVLKKGVNTLRLSADTGAGSAVLKYKPIWF